MSTPTAPRRRAERPRRGAPASAVAAAVLLVLCAALVAASAVVGGAAPEQAGREVVPVDRVVDGCLGLPERDRSRVHTLAAPLDVPASGGRVETKVAGGPGEGPRLPRTPRGEVAGVPGPAAGTALALTATGGAAVGRTSLQADRDADALAVRACETPRPQWWFTGAGASLEHSSRLLVANVETGRAVFDVSVHGPQGPLPTLGTRGVTLEPGEVRSFDTVDLAPQVEDLTLAVEASRGRVVAGVADTSETAAGVEAREWIPAQPRLSRVLRLGPLPRRAENRTLVVTNPADREVLVEVRVSGSGGTFAPTEGAALRVPPGAVATTDLTDAVGRDASAVVLRAPVPVAATVRSEGESDVSYSTAVPALDGPAAGLVADGARVRVQLTASRGGASAEVAAYDDAGEELEAERLRIDPEATAAWPVPRAAAYVVVTPGHGRLAGGLVHSDAGGTSTSPLRSLPVSLRQPVVTPLPG